MPDVEIAWTAATGIVEINETGQGIEKRIADMPTRAPVGALPVGVGGLRLDGVAHPLLNLGMDAFVPTLPVPERRTNHAHVGVLTQAAADGHRPDVAGGRGGAEHHVAVVGRERLVPGARARVADRRRDRRTELAL